MATTGFGKNPSPIAAPSYGSSTHLGYRPDIDGLRAVAILSVIVFHAFPELAPGGFCGVDIFFVISGYLITGNILRDLNSGNFSFSGFYARRIKRILPAFIVILIACYAFGWFALLPSEYEQLGKHIAGGSIFVSNFILLGEAGYFDIAAVGKPLLHLWSLGIEEQFYITWPLLLVFAWKRKFKLFWLTVSIAGISFLFNVYSVRGDAIVSFYSPATRYWELLLGGLLSCLAYTPKHPLSGYKQRMSVMLGKTINSIFPSQNEATLRDIQSASGAALIAVAIFALTKERQFPGWWALLPTLGAYLLISAGPRAWLNRKVLSHRAMVWIGLISFPLYLWHWPLLSFAHIINSAALPSVELRIGLILSAIVSSWLTYKLIESPIRFGSVSRRAPLPFALSAMLIITGLVGLATYKMQGFPSDSRPVVPAGELGERVNGLCSKLLGEKRIFNYCNSNSEAPTILVIGDSQAQGIYEGLINAWGSRKGIILLGNSGCPPLLNTKVYPAYNMNALDHCSNSYAQIFQFIDGQRIEEVFLVGMGRFYIEGDPSNKYAIMRSGIKDSYTAYKLGMADTINKFGKGANIHIVLEIPKFKIDPMECNRKIRFNDDCPVVKSLAEHLSEQKRYREIINAIKDEHANVSVLDTANYFCPGGICSPQPEGVRLYSGTCHLNKTGGRKLMRYFINQSTLLSRL